MPSQRYFNRLFSLYSPAYFIVSKLFSKSRAKQIKVLRSKIPANATVLMVGGGDGRDLSYFSPTNKITYLDASIGMVNKAKIKYANLKNVNFINIDVNEFKSTQQFDAVCIHFVLSVTEKPSDVINNSLKHLKKLGILSIMDVSKPVNGIVGNLLNKILSKTVTDLSLDIKTLVSSYPLKHIYEETLQETKVFKSCIYVKQ